MFKMLMLIPASEHLFYVKFRLSKNVHDRDSKMLHANEFCARNKLAELMQSELNF